MLLIAIEGAAGGPWGFVVGAVVGAITLAFTYWLATLVAPAVEQWINRSIIGRNEGKIQKFADSKSELNALKMTMQGVYVEIGSKMARIDWSDCEDADFEDARGDLTQKQQQVLACRTQKSMEAYNSKNIWFNISVPKFNFSEIDINLKSNNSKSSILNLKYYKDKGSDDLISDPINNRSSSVLAPDFKYKKNIYKLNFSQDFRKNIISDEILLTISILENNYPHNLFYEIFKVKV